MDADSRRGQCLAAHVMCQADTLTLWCGPKKKNRAEARFMGGAERKTVGYMYRSVKTNMRPKQKSFRAK